MLISVRSMVPQVIPSSHTLLVLTSTVKRTISTGMEMDFNQDSPRTRFDTKPVVFTDGAVVRRKDLGDPVNYILALEDATTLLS